MNEVQWIGAGILVVVTAILVADAVTWLMHRMLRPQSSAESRKATNCSCLTRDMINATRTSVRQSTQSAGLRRSGLERPQDVRHAAVLSHSAGR